MAVHSSAKQQPRRQEQRGFLFTLERANRAIPYVERVIRDIIKQHRKVCSLEEKCHIHRPSVPREEHVRVRDQYRAELERLRELADELAAVGCQLKDWRRGTVDFRCQYQGREIELCWQLGEPRIEYWHEITEGFTGRRPVDDDFTSELGEADAVAEPAGAAG